MREHLLRDPIVRVKLWSARGEVIYSDERGLIGAVFPLSSKELDVLNGGPPLAGYSDLGEAENQYEEAHGHLLEVYTGLRTESGEPVLFEAYLEASSVTDNGTRVWRVFLPSKLVSLVFLEMLQVPLAWSMGRRLWRGQKERIALVQHALDVSGAERQRIAGVIHDGVVQQLTGLSYSLEAKAGKLANQAAVPGPEVAVALRQAAADTVESVQTLRGALVDIYPPRLDRGGLAAMISGLFAPLSARGVETRLHVDPRLNLRPQTEALIFGASREVLANVLNHANARSVEERITLENGRAVIVVEDDGVGFLVSSLAQRQSEGHVGIRLVSDLVSSAGGTFNVNSQPGMGTRIRIEVPTT